MCRELLSLLDVECGFDADHAIGKFGDFPGQRVDASSHLAKAAVHVDPQITDMLVAADEANQRRKGWQS